MRWKKRNRSISASGWLTLLTFFSCNSCLCNLLDDCPKHSIKLHTKKMALKTETKKKCFENGEINVFDFFCLLLSQFQVSHHVLVCVCVCVPAVPPPVS